MKDKLIIIAIIQNILQDMQLLMTGAADKGPRGLGALTAYGVMLLHIYHSISGEQWNGTPRELHDWMLKYIKDEAERLGDRGIVTTH